MKHLLNAVAASALLATPLAAQSNLELLGEFKITGTTEHTYIDQNGPSADSIRAVLADIDLPEGFNIDLYALVPDARHMAMAPQGTVLFVGTKKTKVWAVMDRDRDRVADEVTDHSSFSKNRHGRFRESDLLRHVFETTVARCIQEGLVGGQGFAVDASLISADVQKQNSSNPEDWAARVADAGEAPRAVREYLDTLDDEAFGAATTTKPKFTAHADPASQWTAARKGPAFFAYSTNYLIDTDHSIIVDVDASRSNRTAEVGAMRKMIDRTQERFELKPDWIAADTAYGSADNLVWLTTKRKILPFIPVIDKGERSDGTFSRSDFTWDDENDRYICPEGKEMLHTRRTYSDPARKAPEWKARKYRALKADCIDCPLKVKCCPKSETRAIHREKYEIVRDFARQCTASEFNQTAQNRRKKVEMLFAHLKRILGLGRLRLRGPCGVQDEFTLAATAQNLRKLAKLKPMGPAVG